MTTAPAQPPALTPEELQKRAAIELRQTLSFAHTVSLLMRSANYRHYTLGDLEWLVVPPLVTGQFAIAEVRTQPEAPAQPVAVALWASVSPEVDRRLSENVAAPIRLRPDEWRSGDILWVVDAVGDPRALPGLIKQLAETVFKDRPARCRQNDGSGNATLGLLGGPQARA